MTNANIEFWMMIDLVFLYLSFLTFHLFFLVAELAFHTDDSATQDATPCPWIKKIKNCFTLEFCPASVSAEPLWLAACYDEFRPTRKLQLWLVEISWPRQSLRLIPAEDRLNMAASLKCFLRSGKVRAHWENFLFVSPLCVCSCLIE